MIDAYIDHYHHRAHSRLNYRTPSEVRQTWDDATGSLQNIAASTVNTRGERSSDHTLQRRELSAARSLTQYGAHKGASNSKCVRRPFPHQTEAQEKLPLCRPFDSGGGIRTRDLRVMSPTSYQTAPPRGVKEMIAPVSSRGWEVGARGSREV